jgi:hypothetical protein
LGGPCLQSCPSDSVSGLGPRNWVHAGCVAMPRLAMPRPRKCSPEPVSQTRSPHAVAASAALAQAGHWLQLTHSCRQEIRTTGLRAVGHPICKCWGPWPCPCPCPWRWAETSTFSRGTSNATAGAVPARVRRRATSHQTKRCTSASACASLRCRRCFRDGHLHLVLPILSARSGALRGRRGGRATASAPGVRRAERYEQ